MLKHVVMFTFEPDYKADLSEAKAKLEALVNQIPELISMEVGLNLLPSERAMDLVLIAQVKDEAGLAAYQVHPAHQEVVSFLKQRASLSKVVDYI